MQKFKEIDKDHSGKIDVSEAKEGLKSLKTATGRDLDPKEVEFFIETTSDETGQIDLGAFTNLLYRLRLYNAPPPPKDVKLKNPKANEWFDLFKCTGTGFISNKNWEKYRSIAKDVLAAQQISKVIKTKISCKLFPNWT